MVGCKKNIKNRGRQFLIGSQRAADLPLTAFWKNKMSKIWLIIMCNKLSRKLIFRQIVCRYNEMSLILV